MTSEPAHLVIGKPPTYFDLPPEPLRVVFLFGAGASNGCGTILPHQPPVGGELFAKLVESFPQSWGKIPRDLENLFGKGFEIGMAKLWREYPNIKDQLLREASLYFAKFKPGLGVETTYKKIALKLVERGGKDVLLSTTNYDCLLEMGLGAAGCGINYLFSDGGAPIMKLHGSCNWFIEQNFGNVIVTSDIRIHSRIRAVMSQIDLIHELESSSVLHPVFCLYMEGKPAPLCESYFNLLHKDWAERVMAAKNVVIIGAKPYKEDGHIWGPLAKTPAQLIYIGNSDKFDEWRMESGRIREDKVILRDSTDWIEQVFDSFL